MKKVTRDIDLTRAQDLLERVPRARIVYANGQDPQAQPVTLVWRDGRYLVGFSNDTKYLPNPGQEIVLLVDEGVYYFDLRAIYIRGNVRPVDVPMDKNGEYTWFEVEAFKITAWDYGAMREVSDESR